MIKWWLIILFGFWGSVLANEEIEVILNTPLYTNQLMEINASVRIKKHKELKNIILHGKSRGISISNPKEKLVQILWTDIEDQDNAKKISIKNNFISTFKTALKKAKSGTKIPLCGNEQKLIGLVNKLLENTININSLKKDNLCQQKRYVQPVNMPQNIAQRVHDHKEISREASFFKSEENAAKTADFNTQAKAFDQGYSMPSSNNSFNQQLASQQRGNGFDWALNERSISPFVVKVPKKQNKQKEAKKEESIDQIVINTTKEGCEPRVDVNNDIVYVQTKTLKYKNGNKIQESECFDSTEQYKIKKDYLCEKCQDFLDLKQMKAFPTYEKYWIDPSGLKHDVLSTPECDNSLPFPIVEEIATCQPYVDLKNNVAYTQFESVYYDRLNTRKIVDSCHKSDLSEAVAITATMNDCSPTHDFKQGWSILQKKGIFTLNDQEYQAYPCQEVGRPIAHQFDKNVCKPLISMELGFMTPMGKRYILVNGNKLYINNDCEPCDSDIALQKTQEGCNNEFIHDFNENRSYYKKRWFYLDNGKRFYITKCVKSTEYLNHHSEKSGYAHDDQKLQSRIKLTSYIIVDAKKIKLKIDYIDDQKKAIPYVLQDTIDRMTADFKYDGCYRITKTEKTARYLRSDDTVFEIVLGEGKLIRGPDECERTTETKKEKEGKIGKTHLWKNLKRIVTHYPNGEIKYGKWEFVDMTSY